MPLWQVVIVAWVSLILSSTISACGTSPPIPTSTLADDGAGKEDASALLSTSSSARSVSIAFGQVRESPSHLVTDVARAQGFLTAEGLNLAGRRTMPNARFVLEAVAGGSLVMAAVGAEEGIEAIEAGVDGVIIGSYLQKPPHSLMAQPHIKSVAALKGKSLAASTETSGDGALLRTILQQSGLSFPGDYDILTGESVSERVAAMDSGSVAGGLFSPTESQMLVERGKKRLMRAGDAVEEYESTVLLANRQWAMENRALAVGFVRAMRGAMRWIYDPKNKEDAIKLLGRNGRLQSLYATEAYATLVDNRKVLTPDFKINERGFRRTLSIMDYAGRVKGNRDVQKYVDTSYWEQAAYPQPTPQGGS